VEAREWTAFRDDGRVAFTRCLAHMARRTDEDPWHEARETLAAARLHAAEAAGALGSVALKLGAAATAAAQAAATSLRRAVEPKLRSLYEDAIGTTTNAATSVLDHPELVPVSIMFIVALVALLVCRACIYPIGFFKLSALALMMAIPSVAEVLAASAAAGVAIVVTHPSVSAAFQAIMEHPHAATASVFLGLVRDASIDLARAGYDVVASHPQVELLLTDARVHELRAHPHIAATLGHAHLPTLLQWVSALLAVAISSVFLRCLCYCFWCGRGQETAESAAASATRAAKKERQREARAAVREAAKAKAGMHGKPAVGTSRSRLRGVGEFELRDESDERVAWGALVLAPFWSVHRMGSTVWRLLSWFMRTVMRTWEQAAEPEDVPMPSAEDDEDASVGSTDHGGNGAGKPSTAGDGGPSRRKRGGKADAPLISHPRLLTTCKGFAEEVTSADLSQDGTLAVAVSSDRTVRLFPGLQHAGTKTPLPAPLMANIPLDHGTACSLASNGRNLIVATAASRQVLAFTLEPKVVVKRTFPSSGAAAHTGKICAALIAPNSKYIVTVGSELDTTVKLWSLSGDLIASENTKQVEQFGASISVDSRLVAIACTSAVSAQRAVAPRHGQVPIFELVATSTAAEPTGLRRVLCVGGHTRGVTSVSFAKDCVHLGIASLDCEWSVVRTDVRYDLKVEAKEAARGVAPHRTPFSRIALSPFAHRLVGATATGISIVDVAKAARSLKADAYVLQTIEAHGHGAIRALVYSTDGMRVLSGGEDGRLRLWRVEDDDGKMGKL